MDTWWIDEPWLLGSSNPTTADLEQLRAGGFTVVVSLLREDEQSPRYDPYRVLASGYTRHNIPVRDFQAPTIAQLIEFVELLRCASAGTKVLVHCAGGSGRTGMFAAAYWIAKGLSAAEAIDRVRRARPEAVETLEQRSVLEEFAASRATSSP